MKTFISDRGRNITNLQTNLLRKMDGEDATRVVLKAKQLIENLPSPQSVGESRQGLMLGLVQSGKTGAMTTSIALAADNDYRLFIVLTSDILWLYNQTIDRLKQDLQGLEILGKDQWEGLLFATNSITPSGNGLILVSTKNTKMLSNLVTTLDRLKASLGGRLPVALVIDDEADQASLDTRARQRARKPTVTVGRINSLITKLRECFDSHVYLQVTATPQALFLQDLGNLYRPEFTIVIEPGKGYIGGNTFFSLEWGKAEELVRYVPDDELAELLDGRNISIPPSLKKAICIFYVGAASKYLQDKDNQSVLLEDLVYCFLCHVSPKKNDHSKIAEIIKRYIKYLEEGLNSAASPELRSEVEKDLRLAYDDLLATAAGNLLPFGEIYDQLQGFIPGTDIQVLNSNNEEQNQPRYSRRYNILIGGNKLARGVTINNLLVTFYGRQTQRANMDTMLQHARMYGYRDKFLDITRLFVTPQIEERFRLINESEQALRDVVERYPNEEYRGILIGSSINATRKNVLNPNNIGAYVAGQFYFPAKPFYRSTDIATATIQIDQFINEIYPVSEKATVNITIDQMINVVKLTKADPTGSGLWDYSLIIAALESLNNDTRYNNTASLIVLRERRLSRPEKNNGNLRSVQGPDDRKLVKDGKYPTLFMYRQSGLVTDRWEGVPFWIPVVKFPEGRYAIMFNLEQSMYELDD